MAGTSDDDGPKNCPENSGTEIFFRFQIYRPFFKRSKKFGKSVDEESSLTITGTVVGTPYYISPEQALAETDLDFRSDIYSLGVTLYHMVTGTVPYNATTAMAIIMKHINEEFPPPRKHNPKISPGCEQLIKIMMSKERNRRQQSWDELKKDINLVMEGKMPETILPSDETTIVEKTGEKMEDIKQIDKRERKPTARKILIVSIILLSILTLAVGVAVIMGIGMYLFRFKQNPITKGPDSTATTVSPAVTSKGITYNDFCNSLDPNKNTSLAVKDFWTKNVGKEFTWTGKVLNVVGGRRENDIYIDNPSRINYRGYNIILVTTDKEKSATLKKGETISFTGNVYNYKAKSNSLVIVYLKNVKIN